MAAVSYCQIGWTTIHFIKSYYSTNWLFSHWLLFCRWSRHCISNTQSFYTCSQWRRGLRWHHMYCRVCPQLYVWMEEEWDKF